MFSVIIPTYNRRAIVVEAIRSVLNQTCTDFELIIVDDGSTDDTAPRIASLFSDPRLRLIRQENRGPSAARNRGATHAKGRILAFLDSDDLWLPRKLEVQALEFGESPDLLITQTEEIWMRNEVRKQPAPRHRKQGGDFFHRAVDLCLVSPSAAAIRRDFFQDIGGFDEDLPAAEDYDLWLRILARDPIALNPEPLVIKRSGDWAQLSHATPALDRWRIQSLCKILKSGILDEQKRLTARNALRRKATIYMKGCRKRGNLAEADRVEALVKEFEA